MQSNRIFYLFFLLASYISVMAQDPASVNYNTKNGLPSSEVYDVEKDENGLLWFSTDRGVCTYDGYDFKTYTTADGLADNTNFKIFKDSKSRLWFLGYSGNLTIYKDGKFTPYIYNDSLTTILKGYWIDYIIETEEDKMYLVNHFTTERTIIQLDVKSPPVVVEHYKVKEYVNAIKSSIGEIIPFEKSGIFFGNKVPNKKRIEIKFCYRFKNTWLHIVNNKILQGNAAIEILADFTSDKKLSNVYIPPSNDIWLYGEDGIYFFKNGDLTLSPKHYFQGISVTEVNQDFNGNFWITTLRNGIIFVPTFQIETLILPASTSEQFLSAQKLDNYIVFGNNNREILYCDDQLKCKVKKIQNMYSKELKHITKFEDGFYCSGYVATESEKELVFDVNKMVVNSGVNIRANLFDHNFGMELINGDKIFYVERGFSVVKKFDDKYTSSLQMENPFTEKTTKIVETKDEVIWIASLNGLYKLADRINYENVLPYNISEQQSFGRVNDLLPENKNIWVATIGKGLYYSNTKQKKHYKIENLNSDLINTIYTTNDTTLWVGTNKGVNVVNFNHTGDSIRVNNVISLTTKDGLKSNFINDIESWNGNIFLATDKGISYFSNSIITKSHDPVPIQINQLVVNDSVYALVDSLEFNHNENDFFIHFTGLNFRKNKDQNFYRYRLLKDDIYAAWFYTNEKNIRYNNLDPGEYRFEVNAQNNSSEWNKKPAQLSFTIHPHFTQTAWFKILMALLAIGLLVFLYRLQLKRTRIREEANRKLEQAQLRIREAELSALRNQMNPHFVYNALNSIQNFIFKKDIEKANYYLVKFSRIMRSSLNFSRLDLISIKQELDFLNDYIELEQMRFPNKFICNFIVEDELPVKSMMIPSLLLQPVLENVIKHGFKNIDYIGEMNVSFTQNEKNQLKVIIEDNGPGISLSKLNGKDTNSSHESLGLEIIHNRINLLNENNTNTKSSLTFINKKDTNSSKTGLKVVFILPENYG